MNIKLFYHSLLSDWNHGNAHFLRGITTELINRGHQVKVYEPRDGWSYTHWYRENGERGIETFRQVYPGLSSEFYDDSTDFHQILREADLVIVHEWTDPSVIRQLSDLKPRYTFRLLFHDTHHRSVTAPEEIERLDLSNYDGVLAFGEVVRDLYLKKRWAKRAWVWHEAADTNVFRPHDTSEPIGDLVWIGNWGDDERTEELKEFLIEPVQKLGLKTKMYGVRYPPEAQALLKKSGISYGGYLPSWQVPGVLSTYRFTVHIPRRAYARALPGIPTIRPFEALACGIPMISSPWRDSESLFRPEEDYLMVQDGVEMESAMKRLVEDRELSRRVSRNGLETIRNRHTCSHRVDQLLKICSDELSLSLAPGTSSRSDSSNGRTRSINQPDISPL